ncbi:MAG: methyltransferase [Dactylosporangium sp.]|nr:methyltransferase [Dactylosporangium sp.]NNJ61809.1 methyltransferase [Dactylosporangium sp.]
MTDEHYFSAEPTTPDDRRPVEFTVAGRAYRLLAAGGVFSAGRLDPGTAVLLRKAPLPTAPAPAPYLDLGCGYGPIAVVLATASQTPVYAVDVNRRALDLTRTNAALAEVADLVVPALPDEVPPDVRFGEIWSNPPIRIGKTALYGLLDRWLPRLTPAGVAWLVVSRNLGGDSLQRRLVERGWTVERQASQKGYRVLRVTHSMSP